MCACVHFTTAVVKRRGGLAYVGQTGDNAIRTHWYNYSRAVGGKTFHHLPCAQHRRRANLGYLSADWLSPGWGRRPVTGTCSNDPAP